MSVEATNNMEETAQFVVVEFNPVKGSVLECGSCGNQVLWQSHEPPQDCKSCKTSFGE